MGRETDNQWTGPGVSTRRAQDLRIGDRVIRGEHPLTVTSTRLQGVRGGTVSVGPHQVPTGDHIVIGSDPQGATFALVGKL